MKSGATVFIVFLTANLLLACIDTHTMQKKLSSIENAWRHIILSKIISAPEKAAYLPKESIPFLIALYKTQEINKEDYNLLSQLISQSTNLQETRRS